MDTNHRRSTVITRRNARRLTSLPTCTCRPSGKTISIISASWRPLTDGDGRWRSASPRRCGPAQSSPAVSLQGGPRVPDAASSAADLGKRHGGQCSATIRMAALPRLKCSRGLTRCFIQHAPDRCVAVGGGDGADQHGDTG
jgi:hypothetical protein